MKKAVAIISTFWCVVEECNERRLKVEERRSCRNGSEKRCISIVSVMWMAVNDTPTFGDDIRED